MAQFDVDAIVSRVVQVRGFSPSETASAVFARNPELTILRDDYVRECIKCGIPSDVETFAHECGEESFHWLMEIAATVGEYSGGRQGCQGDLDPGVFKHTGKKVDGTPLLNRIRPAAQRRRGLVKAIERRFGTRSYTADFVLPSARVNR